MKILARNILLLALFISQLILSQTNNSNSDNKVKNLAIFWDTSLSMNDKNLGLELSFLDYYIKDKSDLTVQLIKFNTKVNAEQTFQIKKADWTC